MVSYTHAYNIDFQAEKMISKLIFVSTYVRTFVLTFSVQQDQDVDCIAYSLPLQYF